MADQTPIERNSLDTTLDGRYDSQKFGGAFNAKDIRPQPPILTLLERYSKQHTGGAFEVKDAITNGGHQSLTLNGELSFQSSKFTPTGFKTKIQPMVSEYKQLSLNFLDTTGFSNKKYKP